MSLQICSIDWRLIWVPLLACLLANVASAHTLHEPASHALPTSLEEVEDYLTRYRNTGDDALLHRVSDYFGAKTPASERGRYLQAWHAQAAHRFADASAMLAPLLSRGDISAWLLEANLQRIKGDQPASEAACRRVISKSPLIGQACLLQTRVHLGRRIDQSQLAGLEQMHDRMHHRSQLVPEQHAWIMGVIGDAHYLLEDYARALAWSERAFNVRPTLQNRTNYANRLMGLGRHEAALRVIGAESSAPSLALIRVQALHQLGRFKQAKELMHALDHQFRDDIAKGDLLHAREMATFYLDVLPDERRAHRLIIENWARQQELEDRALLDRISLGE